MTPNHAVRWAFRRIRKRIPALVLMTLAHIGSALFGVAFALGTRNVIDSAVSGNQQAFYTACWTQGGIILGTLLCLMLYRHLRDRLAADLDWDWKNSLLNVLLHGDYTQVSGYHSGELLNRLNNDVRILDDGILSVIPNAASMLTRLIAAVAVLSTMEPWFTSVILAVGICVIAVTGFMRKPLKRLHKLVSQHDGKVSGFIQEVLEKLLIVQAMDVSQEIQNRSDDLLRQRYVYQRKRKNVSLLAGMAVSIMSYGAGFVALVWCSSRVLDNAMTFGALTAVTQLVAQLQQPFTNLSGIVPQYISMTAAAERLMELEQLDQDPDVWDMDAKEAYGQLEYIAAEQLNFSYDRDSILSDAEFSLPKGAFAVITGPSGIGKSTLLKLLLGVFRPESGQLYLQLGEKKESVSRATRKLFAYVPQGNLIFSGTLMDNLLITKPDATEEEIRQAIYTSAMDEFLPSLPMGLQTPLGENAAGLSEGQAQRLAIARAVLGGAPILLLDECTSALDAATEDTVLQRIRELKDRTCIAVTHRPAAMALSDWQIIMDDGKLYTVQLGNAEHE